MEEWMKVSVTAQQKYCIIKDTEEAFFLKQCYFRYFRKKENNIKCMLCVSEAKPVICAKQIEIKSSKQKLLKLNYFGRTNKFDNANYSLMVPKGNGKYFQNLKKAKKKEKRGEKITYTEDKIQRCKP